MPFPLKLLPVALQSGDLGRDTECCTPTLGVPAESVGLPDAKKSSVLHLRGIGAGISPLQSLDMKLNIQEVQQWTGIRNQVRGWKIEGKDRRNRIH